MTTRSEQQSWDERLLNMLQQQKALLERLAQLAEYQGSLINEGNTDSLLSLLAERQQMIDRFLALQRDLGGLTENLEARLERVEQGRRKQIQGLIAEIGQLLERVMQHDEQDRQTLETARNQTRDELQEIGNAARARQAYQGAASGTARFADQQG